MRRFAETRNTELIKVGRNTCLSNDGKEGFVFISSKAYKQGNREKYWFAYRRSSLNSLKDCENTYIVFGCNDEDTIVCLPTEVINNVERLNSSIDEDGNISHWHIVFFKVNGGNITWKISRPKIEEININKYVI